MPMLEEAADVAALTGTVSAGPFALMEPADDADFEGFAVPLILKPGAVLIAPPSASALVAPSSHSALAAPPSNVSR